MSATGKTTNYQLPIYMQDDFTDWSDFNKAMEEIDGALHENAETSEGASEAITDIQNSISSLRDAVNTNTETISTSNNKINELETQQALTDQLDEQQNRRITALESGGSGTSEAIQEIRRDVSKNTSDIQENRDQISSLGEETQENKEAINGLTQTTTTHETEISRLKTTSTNQSEQIEELIELVGEGGAGEYSRYGMTNIDYKTKINNVNQTKSLKVIYSEKKVKFLNEQMHIYTDITMFPNTSQYPNSDAISGYSVPSSQIYIDSLINKNAASTIIAQELRGRFTGYFDNPSGQGDVQAYVYGSFYRIALDRNASRISIWAQANPEVFQGYGTEEDKKQFPNNIKGGSIYIKLSFISTEPLLIQSI